ncbi:unnamed protein product, partial [Citrullus colocynthis]
PNPMTKEHPAAMKAHLKRDSATSAAGTSSSARNARLRPDETRAAAASLDDGRAGGGKA